MTVGELLSTELEAAIAQISDGLSEGGIVEMTVTHTLTDEDDETHVRRVVVLLGCDAEGRWFVDEVSTEP